MILLWGIRRDGPIARVHDVLERQGQRPVFLDQRAATGASADMCVGQDLTAVVRIGGEVVDLHDVTAAYLRPYDPRALPASRRAGTGSQTSWHAVLLEDFLASWAELTEALVVNRPSVMAANCSKPFQARQIHDLGFCVPDTLVTTDPEAVARFREKHQRIVYKSISSVRSIVTELTDRQMSRLDDICWCPTQFQELVPGIDYRVHVVGDEIFASEITSAAIDYRYPAQQGCDVTIRAASLPVEIAQQCAAVRGITGLAVSGVDLKCTPEGKWYCFEVNPSPAFTYYQDATGQCIDEAIARLLISGSLAKARRVVASGSIRFGEPQTAALGAEEQRSPASRQHPPHRARVPLLAFVVELYAKGTHEFPRLEFERRRSGRSPARHSPRRVLLAVISASIGAMVWRMWSYSPPGTSGPRAAASCASHKARVRSRLWRSCRN